MNKTGSLFLCLASVAIIAQSQSKPQLADKKQQFAMWFTEASTEFPDKNTIEFDVSGNPVHGYSKAQNLEFSCLSMTGRIFQSVNEKTKESAMRLQKGVMSGQAVLTVKDEQATSVFKSAKATITDDGQTATIIVPGSLTATNTTIGDKGERSMTIIASSGTFTLKSLGVKDENPLLSANLTGPVTVKVDQRGPQGKSELYTLTSGHLSMKAEGDDKILTLTGNVHVSSDTSDEKGPGLTGEFDVAQATVVIDKNNDLKKLTTKGNPGTGTVKEKDKKGGQ